MAVYRQVQMTFWTDSKIDDTFTPEDKYFFLYLITNPHTSLCGCYEISYKQMERETGYNEDTIKRLIERMVTVHKVIDFEPSTNEILLINWVKHNWTSSDKFKKGVKKAIDNIKCERFKKYLVDVVGDTVCIPYPYPMDTRYTSTSNNNIEKEIGVIGEREKTYGLYENVIIDDIDKLKEECPYWEHYIERLSSYMYEHNKTYKNHHKKILEWYRQDEKANKLPQTKETSYDSEKYKQKARGKIEYIPRHS